MTDNTSNNISVKNLLQQVEDILLEKKESPREIANVLKALRMDHPTVSVLESNEEIHVSLAQQIITQFKEDVPVQYITQMAHFFGLRFYVDQHVLIPRPETEELIYKVTQYVQCSPLQILDIGTGSGCIPITLKTKCDQSTVTAIDVSAEALKVAQKNAINHKADIQFKQLDFLDVPQWGTLDIYDVIISNPPYISESEKSKMSISTVLHEPPIALFTDDDPLIFYKKIKDFAHDHLSNIGAIFLELNEYNAEETMAIYSDTYDCQLIEDLQGKARILKCQQKINEN